MALNGLDAAGRRQRATSEGAGIRGNLLRDQYKLRLLHLRNAHDRAISLAQLMRLERELMAAQRLTEQTGDAEMLGVIWVIWKERANLVSKMAWAAQEAGGSKAGAPFIDKAQEYIMCSLDYMSRAQSPILETNTLIGVTSLYLAHGLPVDTKQLQTVAK